MLTDTIVRSHVKKCGVRPLTGTLYLKLLLGGAAEMVGLKSPTEQQWSPWLLCFSKAMELFLSLGEHFKEGVLNKFSMVPV